MHKIIIWPLVILYTEFYVNVVIMILKFIKKKKAPCIFWSIFYNWCYCYCSPDIIDIDLSIPRQSQLYLICVPFLCICCQSNLIYVFFSFTFIILLHNQSTTTVSIKQLTHFYFKCFVSCFSYLFQSVCSPWSTVINNGHYTFIQFIIRVLYSFI